MNERIWLIGDLHGNFAPIERFWKRNKKIYNFSPETDIMICLGDFCGNYFLSSKDSVFKERLRKYNLTFFVIRGNHEERPSICMKNNPDKWTMDSMFKNFVYVEKDFDFIKYALDVPAIYNIQGYKTLIVPGAYSVDKNYRLAKGWNWFENEQLTREEKDECLKMLKNKKNKDLDLILSHTCPQFWQPKDLFLSQIDQSSVDSSMERFLDLVERKVTFKAWLWGHYHVYRELPRADAMISTTSPKRIMLSDGKEVLNLDQIFLEKENRKY